MGGTAQEGVEDRTPDPAMTEAIQARCASHVPAVRLEAEGRVVHCYGHGGAGVTLAWGCAFEVAALLGAEAKRYAGPR